MKMKRYIAEALGTFTLALTVLLSVSGFSQTFPTPLLAAIVVALFVYLIGGISGAQLNPAVTLGLWSTGELKAKDALLCMLAQIIGGLCAILFTMALAIPTNGVAAVESVPAFVGEAVGAFMLAFTVYSVVQGKIMPAVAGVAIGMGLFVGITVASGASLGILNPAVTVALGAYSVTYILGPLVGGVAGMWAAKWLYGVK